MIYVARQRFTVGSKGTQPRRVEIGEAVPEAEKWDDMTLRSHLNMGWIEKVPGEYPLEAKGAAKPVKKPGKPKPKPKAAQEASQVDQAS